LLSPPPIITRPSEKTYRSRKSLKDPLSLPSLADVGSIDLSVIIPAYNETSRLPSMLETTLDHLNSASIQQTRTYELVIVDDGSKDDTSALALKLTQQHLKSDNRVVTLEKNLGTGGVVRHGMLHARGNRLLMVDADGVSRFEDLELLWEKMDELGPKNELLLLQEVNRASLMLDARSFYPSVTHSDRLTYAKKLKKPNLASISKS
jgi:dolichyl-phosphate beta-glucosyltransferase